MRVYKKLVSVVDVIVGIFRVVTVRVGHASEVGIDVQRRVFLSDERRRKMTLTSPGETVLGETIVIPYCVASTQKLLWHGRVRYSAYEDKRVRLL